MSGGRATLMLKQGKKIQQVGDLCAVRPELHDFCSKFFIECKHYRSLDLEAFMLRNKGVLASHWRTACREAANHNRSPMVLARQNRLPDLLITAYNKLTHPTLSPIVEKRGQWEIWWMGDVFSWPYTSFEVA